MESNFNQSYSTIRDYLKVVFRRKWVIISTVFLVMFTVNVGLQFKTPEYEAKVKMLILARKQIDSPYYKDISEFRSSEITLTQSEIVKSNPVLERVINTLDMATTPLNVEKEFATPLKSILVDLNVKKLEKKLEKLSEQEKIEFLSRKTLQELKKKIKVEPLKETDLFIITVKNFNAVDAAKIANTISRSYCIFDLEQQLAEIQQKYGDKHYFVIQLKDTLKLMEENLKNPTLSNIEAIGPASVKIIEQATIPIEPIGVSNSIIIVVAFLMSIILGIVLASMFEYMDSTFKSPEEIKAFLHNIAFLGYVPKVTSWPGKILLILGKASIVFASYMVFISLLRLSGEILGADTENPIIKFATESTQPLFILTRLIPGGALVSYIASWVILIGGSFGISKLLFHFARIFNKRKLMLKTEGKTNKSYMAIYQNLSELVYLSMKGNEQKSALITSSLCGEGASTILANMGLYLANKANNKILLIDANLRKPRLHKIFKVESKPGLMEILSGECSLDDALENVGQNLSIVPAGNKPSDSVALLNPEKMLNIVKEAEKKFDLILIDCSNLKNYKDAIAFSSYVDGVILVINEGKTRREVLKSAVLPLEKKKITFIGAILNNRTFAIPQIIYDRS